MICGMGKVFCLGDIFFFAVHQCRRHTHTGTACGPIVHFVTPRLGFLEKWISQPQENGKAKVPPQELQWRHTDFCSPDGSGSTAGPTLRDRKTI